MNMNNQLDIEYMIQHCQWTMYLMHMVCHQHWLVHNTDPQDMLYIQMHYHRWNTCLQDMGLILVNRFGDNSNQLDM
jgi:hypothetical protein